MGHLGSRGPSWGQSRHSEPEPRLPVYPSQRTSSDRSRWWHETDMPMPSPLSSVPGRTDNANLADPLLFLTDFVAKVGCDRRCRSPISLRVTGVWPPTPTLRNFYATQYREPGRAAVVQPAMRTGAGSERWRPEQTHPGRLVDHAVEVGRASGCVSGAQTASRSSCAHVAMSRSPRCQRATGQRRGLGQRTKSPFVACLNRFLQQNRPKANVGLASRDYGLSPSKNSNPSLRHLGLYTLRVGRGEP